MKRRSFIFYASYYEAIRDLPDEMQGRMYKIIVDYAMSQQEPTEDKLQGVLKSYFKLIKPNIDAGIRRYENGLKGGAPKGNKNAQKNTDEKTTKKQPNTQVEKQPQNNPKTTVKQPQKDLENENRLKIDENQQKNNLKTSKKQPKNNLETTKIQPKNNLKTTEKQPDIYLDIIKEQELEQEQEQEQDVVYSNEQTNVRVIVEDWLEILFLRLHNLNAEQYLDNSITERIRQMFLKVANEPNWNIDKTTLPNYKILEKFVDLFRAEPSVVQDMFYKTFKVIDEKTNIANKLKYAVGVFYNKSCGF